MSNAPLLLEIPLLHEAAMTTRSYNDEEVGFMDDDVSFLWDALPAPARVPVRIWLCSDGRLGACMYGSTKPTTHSSSSSSGNSSQNTVSVVLFSLPQATSALVLPRQTNFRLNHVHVPCQEQQDFAPSKDCNLLWLVHSVPHRERATGEVASKHNINHFHSSSSWSWLCDTVVEGPPAYLFLIDEEDGYRLTWIREAAWHESELKHRRVRSIWNDDACCDYGGSSSKEQQQQHRKQQAVIRSTVDTRIVVPVSTVDAGWETVVVDRQTGAILDVTNESEDNQIGPQFKIEFTGFLSATSLLFSILLRRPSLVRPRFDGTVATLPSSYSYHLVGVNGRGRTIELLLVFSVGLGGGQGCIGVFVEVDLLTQDYREREWIRHAAADTPPASCGFLAMDRRRRQLCPFDYSCSAISIAGEMHRSWTKFGNDASLLVSLYPDCHTMDNLAVRRQIPIMSMSACSAPIEVAYC